MQSMSRTQQSAESVITKFARYGGRQATIIKWYIAAGWNEAITVHMWKHKDNQANYGTTLIYLCKSI